MQAVQTLKNSLSLYPAQIASAKANIEIAESRLAEAIRDVDRTEVSSPFAGVLAGVRLEPDQYVAASERLFELHDVHSIEIESQFSLSQLSRLIPTVPQPSDAEVPVSRHVHSIHSAGLSAVVTTRSGDLAVQYVGQPVRVRESIDGQTRTLGIVVRVANHLGKPSGAEQLQSDARASSTTVPIAGPPKMPLRPGAYCEVTLIRKLPVAGILVPRTAVEDDIVWVVEDNRLRRRQVRVGFAVGDQAAIIDGLTDDDLVVVKPLAFLTEGKLVSPEPAEPIDEELLSSRDVAETR
jgi:multidrug efflux pump subunit AcrA (membrane-fusion protein)